MVNHGIATSLLMLFSLGLVAEANDQLQRDVVIQALFKHDVVVSGLDLKPELGGPQIALGTGKNGARNESSNDENLELIANLPELEAVTIYYGRFTADGLAKLAALPKLKRISFLSPSVEPAVFAGLAEMKSLEEVRFVQYRVTDEILGYLNELPALNSFEATQMTGEALSVAAVKKFLRARNDLQKFLLTTEAVDDDVLKELGRMKSLQDLVLTSRKVTPVGWRELASLKKLKRLDIRGTSFDDESAKALKGMVELHSLVLSQTRITDASMASLAGLTNLRDLILDDTKVTDAGMEHLKQLTQLENLYVTRTAVTAKGLAFVPRKERMLMMSVGQGELSPQQFGEIHRLFPDTQMFDPAGYWTPERVTKALKKLAAALN